MMEPLRLRLLHSLATALRGIRQADGYYYTVKPESVMLDPVNILTVAATALPVFLVEPSTEGVRTYQPANRLEYAFFASITARVEADSLGASRKTEAWERLLADIERALTRDITREGLAIDTRLGEPTPLSTIGPDSMVLVLQPVELRHVRVYGEPA